MAERPLRLALTLSPARWRCTDLMKRWGWVAATGVAATLALTAFFALRPERARPMLRAPPPVPTGARPVVTAGSHSGLDSQPTRKNSSYVSRAEWAARFRASDGYLKFVNEALPAAMSGDGRGAWYIKEALSSCALVMRMYRGSADPQAKLQQQLESMPNAPQWARDVLANKRTRRTAVTDWHNRVIHL